ncbi:MAG TPA: GAF domain-containing protein [Thermoanaerobaculia bacterium]|nr:GAF domain-containing protein [Thermoanaerobaculia bacterium]
MRLADISRCFQGVIPSVIGTSDRSGTPNVTYVSQVYLVDEDHVALSCQFFNKTRRNLDENPRVAAEVYDPANMQAYRLKLRFLRSEKSGPLFDTMAVRIEAIASHTGMSGVFRLIAADIFAVDSVEKVEGFLAETFSTDPRDAITLTGMKTELRGLQYISDRINRARDLEEMLSSTLEAMEEFFGFEHSMVLINEESCGKLIAIASRGFGESGVGAEVRHGEGLIGTVARERRVIRMSNLEAGLRYGRAVRREVLEDHGNATPEIPLPGLCDAQSALIIPLTIGDRLIGVLSCEDPDPLRFHEWHEAYMEVIGNQIALGLDRMLAEEQEDEHPPVVAQVVARDGVRRTLTYYRNDDSVFLDGEYLIRNVPGRILWKLLREWQRGGRTEFSNRELRLDPALKLPELKDNLESRLILLRKRLEEKCEEVRIVPTGRGRFALNVAQGIELVER